MHKRNKRVLQVLHLLVLLFSPLLTFFLFPLIQLNELMERAGKLLNLKHHRAGLAHGKQVDIYGPADIEGHLGDVCTEIVHLLSGHVIVFYRSALLYSNSSCNMDVLCEKSCPYSLIMHPKSPQDQRFYVIDLARVFPPTAEPEYVVHLRNLSPNTSPLLSLSQSSTLSRTAIMSFLSIASRSKPLLRSVEQSFLYKLFRPEFVKNYPKPLSSDAFSPFGDPDNKTLHNDEVIGMTTSSCRRACVFVGAVSVPVSLRLCVYVM